MIYMLKRVGTSVARINPSNDMPAYAPSVMSDQAVADVLAFLQSLPGPRNPKDIAILGD